MSGLSTPTPVRLVPTDPGDGYVPGACNIGPWEIRRRRTAAIGAFVAAAALFGILAAVDAPPWTRISWLQARRHFCVAYAMGGMSNFGDAEATRRAVVDPVQRAADRRATVLLLRDAFLVALVPTIVAVILPI